MVEREPRIGGLAALVRGDPCAEVDRVAELLQRGQVLCGVEEAEHHRGGHARQAPHDLRQLRATVEVLAAVGVAVGRDEHLGFDLGEAVEHPVHTEVG